MRFDCHFKLKDLQVLLVVNSCTENGSNGTLLLLKNTEILFLSRKIISKLQPSHTGEIDAMKVWYHSFQMERSSVGNGAWRHLKILNYFSNVRLQAHLEWARNWKFLGAYSSVGIWKCFWRSEELGAGLSRSKQVKLYHWASRSYKIAMQCRGPTKTRRLDLMYH